MKKWQVRGSAAAFLLLLMAVAGRVTAPVYYLNDDVTMRSILSGACTGIPDAHAVYMKYPLTGLLAGLYRLTGKLGVSVPWFDLFLAGCVLLAGAGILAGCVEAAGEKRAGGRAAAALLGILFFAGLFLPHYLYLHYTIVAAILAGGALFLWEAGPGRALPVLLLVLCYQVRSQVFYLALPFLLVAVLDRGLEAVRRRSGNLAAGIPLAVLALAVAACWGVDRIGYGSEEWQSYREYNASRTSLYDYTDFLSTDRYRERYEELGLSLEQYQVLAHYDTVLDQEIDARVLDRTVTRLAALRGEAAGAGYLRQCLESYYRHVRYDGRPYSLVWAGGYGILLFLLALHRRWDRLLLVGALLAGRSLIWVYLIARGRFPERIWISLYLMELCLLLGMTLRESAGGREVWGGSKNRWVCAGIVSLGLALLCLTAAVELPRTAARAEEQQRKQAQWNLLTESLEAEENTFYLMDVFSAVAYAGEVYKKDSEQIMLLGGWLTQSPLVAQRLAAYDASDGAQALLHGQVRLIAAGDRDISWLEAYLAGRLGAVELKARESVSCGEDVEFVIYQLEDKNAAYPECRAFSCRKDGLFTANVEES